MEMSWMAEQLRISVFLREGEVLDAALEESMGLEPEETTSKRVTQEKSEIASLGVGKVHLTVGPKRVDWVWQCPPDTEDRHLGGIGEAVGSFVPPIVRFLGERDIKFDRLALGALVIIPTASRKESYGILQGIFSGLDLNPDHVQEFMLQMNHPAVIDVRGSQVKINNMKQWSARKVELAQLRIEQGGVVETTSTPINSVACLFDINTVPAANLSFSGEELPSIYNEFPALLLNALPKEVS